MRINLNGPILSAMSRVFDALLTMALFVLFCLPVITVGASLSAMYATMICIAGDGCSSVTSYFWNAFRSNFKMATGLWVIDALVGAVVVADIAICWGFGMEPNMGLAVMRGLTVFCTALFLAVSVYTFAGIAVYRVTWKQAIANSLFWTAKKIPATLGLVLLCVGSVAAVLILWYFAIPIVAFFLYLQGKLLLRVFALEQPKVHLEEEIDYS